MERAGLERIEATAHRSIPNEHEAVMQDDGDGEPHVDDVLRTGWKLKGRVLRPAMVKVTRTEGVTQWRAQREWFEKDYYAVLGVPQGASEKELSRAFKKLAKQYHPDANPGNTAAEEKLQGDLRRVRRARRRDEAHRVRRGSPDGRVRRRSRRLRRIRSRAAFGGGGQTFRFETRRRRARRHLRQPVRRWRRPPAAPRRDRSAARPRSRDGTAHPVRRRDPRCHLDGAIPRRGDVLDVRGFGRGAGHDAGDVPASAAAAARSPTTRVRSRSRRCAPRVAAAARSSRTRARRATGAVSKCAPAR